MLYAFGSSPWLTELLVLHLGSVLAFFLLTPFTKMTHGFYRLAALVKEAKDSSAQASTFMTYKTLKKELRT